MGTTGIPEKKVKNGTRSPSLCYYDDPPDDQEKQQQVTTGNTLMPGKVDDRID